MSACCSALLREKDTILARRPARAWWGVLVVLLLGVGLRAGATAETDSLTRLLRVETRDTSRVLLLRDLSFAYYGSRPDLAIRYAQQGLRLARQIGFKRGEAACLNTYGAAYMGMDKLPQALKYFLAALQLNEQIGYRKGVAASLGNIGRIYAAQGDHRASLRYAFRAKAMLETVQPGPYVTLQLLNIGSEYLSMNRSDSALYFTQQGYRRALREQDAQNLIIALNNLGLLYSERGERATALRYYRQAIPHALENGYVQFVCVNYLNIAQVFEHQKQADSLLRYARLALTTAQRNGLYKQIMEACTLLTKHYESQGRADSLSRYLGLAVVARDSVYNQEKVQTVQRMLFEETIRQQEQQAAQEQARQARRYNLQLMGIAVFILSFSALLVPLSRRLAHTRVVQVLGIVTLLMVFEFVMLLTEPAVERFTKGSPVLLLLAMMGLAAVLAPLHQRLERWVRRRLVKTGRVREGES